MLTGATMKEVKEGYILMDTQTLKVLGDFTLDDKADHLMMMRILLSVVFVFNPPTEVAFPFVFTMWQ